MKIENLFLLVQIDGKIHQAILTDDQEMAVKSILMIVGDTIKCIEEPIQTIET